jgi:hypothetical protein
MHGLLLACRSRAVAIGPYIRGGEWLRVRYVRVESHQQRGAFLDEPYPGVPVAVYAAFVPFGLAKPAFQVEVVLGHVCLLPPTNSPGAKLAITWPMWCRIGSSLVWNCACKT